MAHKHEALSGLDENNNFKTAPSKQYPPFMFEVVAKGVIEHIKARAPVAREVDWNSFMSTDAAVFFFSSTCLKLYKAQKRFVASFQCLWGKRLWKSNVRVPSMTVLLVRSIAPFVSERFGSDLSCRMPSPRQAAGSTGVY